MSSSMSTPPGGGSAILLGIASVLVVIAVLEIPRLVDKASGIEPEPAPITQRWCPPTIQDGPHVRKLTRSIWRAPDHEEAALGCFYAPVKPARQS